MSARTFLVSFVLFVLATSIACSTAPSSTNTDDPGDDSGNDSRDSKGGKGDGNNPIGTPVSTNTDAGSTATTSTDAGAPSTCQTPRVLGSIKGDVVGPNVTAKGTCSEWLQLRATEDSAAGDPMLLRITLVPDSTIDFDLYVYLGADDNQVECSTTEAQSTLTGTSVEVATLQWGEDGFPNGRDDDRTISIEVRAKNAKDCTPTASDGGAAFSNWTLLVEGDKSE